jgi:hypothetical protein
MDIQRKGTEFYLDLDLKEDILGLFAVMNSRPDMVSKETYEKGMKIYGWLFEQVKELHDNYEKETSIPYRKKDKKKK